MAHDAQLIDGVFKGGDVKGIALVGAVAVTEERGYRFAHVAGTSSGALVAALIAAGYRAGQMQYLLENLDYTKFKDRRLLDRIPLLGAAWRLAFEQGL